MPGVVGWVEVELCFFIHLWCHDNGKQSVANQAGGCAGILADATMEIIKTDHMGATLTSVVVVRDSFEQTDYRANADHAYVGVVRLWDQCFA
jgi:hypothetical protein